MFVENRFFFIFVTIILESLVCTDFGSIGFVPVEQTPCALAVKTSQLESRLSVTPHTPPFSLDLGLLTLLTAVVHLTVLLSLSACLPA